MRYTNTRMRNMKNLAMKNDCGIFSVSMFSFISSLLFFEIVVAVLWALMGCYFLMAPVMLSLFCFGVLLFLYFETVACHKTWILV